MKSKREPKTSPSGKVAPTIRNPFWDNAKGILIFLVVLGHYTQWNLMDVYAYKVLYNTIYTFHMPAFAFIAGFFAPSKPNIRRVGGFLGLLIIFQIGSHIWAAHSGFMPTFPYIYKYPLWTLWYLLSLVYWYLILWYIPIKRFYLLMLSVPLYIVGAWIIEDGFLLSILRTLYFLPFVVLGKWIKEEKNALPPIRKPIALALFITGVGILSNWSGLINGNWFNGVYNFYQLDASPMESITGTLYYYAIALFLGYTLISSMPSTKVPLLTRMGEQSLSIYLWHGLIVLTTTYYGITGMLDIHNPLNLLTITALTAIIATLPPFTTIVNAIAGNRSPMGGKNKP